MKIHLRALFLMTLCLLLPHLALAQEKNGIRLTVQKTTLSRDDVNNRAFYADTIDRTMGLKVNVRNISMADMEPSTLEHSMIISRWSYSPMRYELYSGSEKVDALKPQGSVDLVVGSAQIGGYKNYAQRRNQDKVEGWKVVIKRGGTEVASFQSSSSFDGMLKKAVKGSSSGN